MVEGFTLSRTAWLEVVAAKLLLYIHYATYLAYNIFVIYVITFIMLYSYFVAWHGCMSVCLYKTHGTRTHNKGSALKHHMVPVQGKTCTPALIFRK